MTKYQRVLPRDLFNEAKLLKCMGHLVLLIMGCKTPVTMGYGDEGCDEGFEIGLLEEGSLTIKNLPVSIRGKVFLFKTTYNSRANYPLYVQDKNYCDYLVFNEQGEFSEDFINFCNTIHK